MMTDVDQVEHFPTFAGWGGRSLKARPYFKLSKNCSTTPNPRTHSKGKCYKAT